MFLEGIDERRNTSSRTLKTQNHPHHVTVPDATHLTIEIVMNQPVAYELTAPHEPLGETMDIREVAELLGCSAWTVRHRYLAQGLPHLRVSPRGKLVFFRAQITRWIFERQRKGGF